MTRAYGEYAIAGTPTIGFMRHQYGIKEPINAITALFITYCAVNVDPQLRDVQWARGYIMFNGCASCFMHSLLPQQKDPYVLQVIANMDGTSMLGAVTCGVIALVEYPEIPIEASLIPFIMVAVLDWTASDWFEIVFGTLWAVVILWTYLVIDPADFEEYMTITVGVIIAAACQIIDQWPPRKGETLGVIRQNIPLHAVWHIRKWQ